ncbi:wax ester/triacylglycerol synthase family O-acyltransferase [Variovorax dokdonensis]|uniref:diacylglycerol O-acyltransferase n=1 Tax=Variovorax dokdonensis TaxID=344883 RepID=A0ABT7N7N5_9BURK|nr:wax ester/triacylglycerol synthase family O-acyltransferase [Variovorax dokdonensis]MDM0043895.1 wax ester/triacylglycerol synthase family O-acyltransferase [Variovorax dokdonensis]
MKKPIPPIDLLFLLGESRDAPQHVAGLMIFENPAPSSGWSIADLVARYRAAKPIFPFNVVPKLSLFDLPCWVEVEQIDMNYHVQHLALPAPGTDDQVNEMVQRWHDTLFDRGQPLFQVCVIEGLQDDRFAIYVKLHHAIVDGASAIARILGAVSEDPAAPLGDPLYAIDVMAPEDRSTELPPTLAKQWLGMANRAAKGSLIAADLYVGFLKKTASRMRGAPPSGSRPFEAPMTVFNERVVHGRSYARTSLPMAQLKAAAKAAGGTLNDVALTLVDDAVHHYLAERKKPLAQRLLALVPVSLREAGDKEATTKISALVIAMGDGQAAVRNRLAQVMEHMKEGKAELQAMSKAAAGGYSVAMYSLANAMGKLGFDKPLANMIISNVPGSPKQMYLGGSRMLGVFPVSVISVGMGLNVTLVSNAGRLDVGITSQRRSIPDPERIAGLMLDSLNAMMADTEPATPAGVIEGDTKPTRAPRVARKASRRPTPKAAQQPN